MPEMNSDNEDIAPLPSAIKQSAQPMLLSKDIADRIAAGTISINLPPHQRKAKTVIAGSTSISVSCKEEVKVYKFQITVKVFGKKI